MAPPVPRTLFRDVGVFDSRVGRLTASQNVLVEGRTIHSIRPFDQSASTGNEDAAVIDGGGRRTLIPGLIDAHWHGAFAAVPLQAAMTADSGYIQLVSGKIATETLLRGFTTVRDCGGPVFGLKQSIDSGVLAGPRIFPSGAMISQTSGHGDFRLPYETPRGICGHLSYSEQVGAAVIADGVDEVLRAVREQLRGGASQIKLMAGGGVASPYDPLDVTQYTASELRAAVEAAEDWGTYVMVHAYTPRAVRRAIDVGVRSIEHGHLLDDATVELIAREDVWWCLQPFLDDDDAVPLVGDNRVKFLQMTAGTDRAYVLAKKHGARVAWGTDILFDPDLTTKQGKLLAKMVRWFTPAEVLTMATATNAELLGQSGPRNPYPGTLGVIEEGALADLLLVEGNPLDDISLLTRPDTALAVIMKDGLIVKNTLAAAAKN